MDQLQQARAQIDEIDAKMAALFEQRMQAVGQVAQYKARTGKQVFDPAREALVLEKNTARVQNPELQPYYREFLKKALAVSRAYQHVLIGQDVAAYQGVEGAWSHIALRQLFPFAKAQAYSTWNEVVEAVERGDAYCGVLPFENSNAGDVSAVLDLLYAHPGLKVARMCDLPIRQDLLALPGAQLSEIKTVISHQQALAQSGPFLKLHHFATKAWGNTADAARYVAEQGDQTLAAIASAETAKLYGLQILAEGVNEDGDNTTRFIVLSKEKPTAGNRFSLLFTVDNKAGKLAAAPGQRLSMLFTVDHKPGRLARVIQIIGERGFNMETIKSRPLPHVQFEYYFYVQLVCPANAATDDCAKLVHELENVCRTVRILGVFDL